MNSTFKKQLRMHNGPESPIPYALGLLLYVKGVTNSG
jgi:hypothetical protein